MKLHTNKYAITALLIAIFMLGFEMNISAQTEDKPVIWEYEIEKKDTGNYTLKITAKIDKAWYMYGRDFEQGGPLPLQISFETDENSELAGKLSESKKPTEEDDDIFGIRINYFAGTVIFTQAITVTDSPSLVSIYIEGQACRKENGICVAIGDEQTFSIQ